MHDERNYGFGITRGGTFLAINQAQQYFISKVKTIKADTIVENVKNDTRNEILLTRKIIMGRMSKVLQDEFQIKRIRDLPIDMLEKYLYAIMQFRFFYNGKYYT